MNTVVVWWVAIPIILPALFLCGLVATWRWRLNQRAERAPIADKLLRPAGESLRVKMDTLSDKLMDALLICVFAPAFGLWAAVLLPIQGLVLVRFTSALLTAIGAFCFLARRVFILLRELRNCRLGFHGERAVGEEINQLMSDGCRVFHDVPMEPYGNVDHVIVAPSGVYAVETKTRRKRKAPSGKREHEVVFDGKTLQFPNGTDTDSLEQARQQADRMRNFLSKAVGEPVKVSPILTLPGWYVSSRVNDGLKVLNPKQIRQVVANGQAGKLTPSLMQRISYQLDQKCRDVAL